MLTAFSFNIHLKSKMVGGVGVKCGTLDSNLNCSLVSGCDVNQAGEMEGEVLTRKAECETEAPLLTHSSHSTCNFSTG